MDPVPLFPYDVLWSQAAFSLVALHQNSGLSGHSEPLPHRVESFAGLCFHTHATGIDSQHARDVFAHGVDVGPEFWCFEQNCRVDVDYVKTAFAGQPHHPRKQFKTTCATPLWIFFGEMHSDIAFAKSAEDRVGDSVTQRVRIRVAFSTAIRNDVHAPQHKLPPFNEAMRVNADSDPYHLF